MRAKERNDLIISWFTISLAFAWILGTRMGKVLTAILGIDSNIVSDFFIVLPIALVAVGAGFILHELAHRYVAKKYGCHAEYRMWGTMLVLALVLALFAGVVFAAPGAVYIYGRHLTRKQNGLISLAGPGTNLLVALAFVVLYIFAANPFLITLALIGAYVNLFLAAFNLLPVFGLDGSKVFTWNPGIWALFFLPSAALVLFFMFLV